MKIRTKVFLGYFIAAATALYFLMQWVKDDVRARYLEAVEENMVDMVNTLATLCETTVKNDQVDIAELKEIYNRLKQRHIKAKIYNITKTEVDAQIYLTDNRGIVLFDSEHPENIGRNFSSWNDVKRTLRGEYGARATRINSEDPESLILYVAAPIKSNGKQIAVITLYKPISTLVRFIHLAEGRISKNAILALIMLLILGAVTSTWITTPILKLKKYVDNIRDGRKANVPDLGKGEIAELAQSFEEMREALEGKKYVESYVRNLTHELKSPLSAIQGALELLREKDVPYEQQEKFIKNMQHESKRMRQLVDRMLLLSQLENINTIHAKKSVDLKKIITEISNSVKTSSPDKKVNIRLPESPAVINGDTLLIYEAIDNIVKNAVEFTRNDGKIDITCDIDLHYITISVSDNGAGIPEYALSKVYEKFFSLPRPESDEKSSGLGLSITREIVELHNGTVTVESCENRGTTVTIQFKRV